MNSRAICESGDVYASHEADHPRNASVHPRVLDINELLAGQTEVILRHGAELYRLRLTRQNRLILTK